MTATPLPVAAADLAALLDVLPGPDFGVDIAAAALGDHVDTAAAAAMIGELVAAGILEPCTSLPGAQPRFRSTDASRACARPPVDGEEKDAVHRVLRHLLARCLAASQCLAPVQRRLTELESPPRFAAEADAMTWFTAESTSVLDAHDIAAAMRDLPLTWQLAEALGPLLAHAGRHEEQLAVLKAGMSAARQLRHRAQGSLAAQAAATLIALGRHEDARRAGKQAQAVADLCSDERGRFDAHLVLGRAHRAAGRHPDALANMRAAQQISIRLLATEPATHLLLDLVATELTMTYLADTDIDDDAVIERLTQDLRWRHELAVARVALVRAQGDTGHSPGTNTAPGDSPPSPAATSRPDPRN